MSILPKNPNEGLKFNENTLKTIYLAGGCFWGVEAYLERIYGVAYTEVGYANGFTENPSYEDVCSKHTGHAETVLVKYDPEKISLEKLLEAYFKIINPTSLNKQGNDIGSQYRTGIYYTDSNDEIIINAFIKQEQSNYNKLIVVEVKALENYYRAEEYHQKYLENNPNGYCHLNLNSVLPE